MHIDHSQLKTILKVRISWALRITVSSEDLSLLGFDFYKNANCGALEGVVPIVLLSELCFQRYLLSVFLAAVPCRFCSSIVTLSGITPLFA